MGTEKIGDVVCRAILSCKNCLLSKCLWLGGLNMPSCRQGWMDVDETDQLDKWTANNCTSFEVLPTDSTTKRSLPIVLEAHNSKEDVSDARVLISGHGCIILAFLVLIIFVSLGVSAFKKFRRRGRMANYIQMAQIQFNMQALHPQQPEPEEPELAQGEWEDKELLV